MGEGQGLAHQIRPEVCKIFSPESSMLMAEGYDLLIDLLIKIQKHCLNTWSIHFSTYERNITFLWALSCLLHFQ